MTSWSLRGASGTSCSASVIVCPVIDSASPCSTPCASRIFMTWGTPPARWRSTVTNFPDGFRSHSPGTRARIVSKSSRARCTSAAWAMASRCSTALVEPPMAMVTAMAFSNAWRVRICRGRRSRAIASTSTVADRAALHLQELGGIDAAGRVFAHRLEHAHDGEVAPGVVSRLDRPAVHEHGRDVHAGDRDHGARHVLVTPADHEQAVHALRIARGLDRVGDDLA